MKMEKKSQAQIVSDLKRWLPVMELEVSVVLSAVKASHAHTTGLQADSQPERAVFTRLKFERDLSLIRAAARSTGWRSDDLDGSP